MHAHTDREVRLDVWWIDAYDDDVSPLEGQPLRWARIDELDAIGLISADQPIIDAIRRELDLSTARA